MEIVIISLLWSIPLALLITHILHLSSLWAFLVGMSMGSLGYLITSFLLRNWGKRTDGY